MASDTVRMELVLKDTIGGQFRDRANYIVGLRSRCRGVRRATEVGTIGSQVGGNSFRCSPAKIKTLAESAEGGDSRGVRTDRPRRRRGWSGERPQIRAPCDRMVL